MFLKSVSFSDSSSHSPWPTRLTGLEAFQSPTRNADQVLAEYNDNWYKKALELWYQYAQANTEIRPSRFFRLWDGFLRDSIIRNVEVYGVSNDEHLISVNQALFTANWSLVTALYDNLVTETLESYVDQFKTSTLLELGCGDGRNLFKLYEKINIKRLIGGDICSNAVELGNSILAHSHIPGEFRLFDFYEDNGVSTIASDIEEDYLLVTSHAIEQIQIQQTNLIDQVLALPHKPDAVIHFEPIVFRDDDSKLGRFHRLYADKNHYNTDLLDAIRAYEAQGAIEVISLEKSVLGTGAFNPSSVLVWRCAR